MRRNAAPPLVVVTDRIGDTLTNGSQFLAHALTARLGQWFDLTVVARAGCEGDVTGNQRTLLVPEEAGGSAIAEWLDRHLDPPLEALVYNLGGTAFSSATAVALRTLHPHLSLVNHFQVNLRRYADVEGREPEEGAALDTIQRVAAAGAERNLFASFAELHLAIISGWPRALGAGYVVPNAFVDAGVPVRPRPSRDATVVAAGRFSDYVKGGDLLLRAFGGVHRRHRAARLRVASDDDGFADAVPRELRGAVCLLGWLDRAALHEVMRDADVVVVPSRYEPFGLVALEAMAMGTPVIAMAVGGLAEIIHDGRTGWLTPEDDGSLGLQLAMEDALSNRARTRRMGREAMRAVRRSFHLDGVAELVRRHLDQVRQASSWHARADRLLTLLERRP